MAGHQTRATFRDSFIAILLVSGFVLGIRAAPRETPVLALPPPTQIAQISYSGPLTLTQVSESVLGTETIDPVEFVEVINSEREKVGSPELRLSTTLMRAAQMRVEVMKKYQHFSHQDPKMKEAEPFTTATSRWYSSTTRSSRLEKHESTPYTGYMARRYDANERVSWKNIIANNFLGGLMWGLGSVIGATFILSLFLGTLRRFEFVPFIADTLIRIQNVMESRQ